MLLIGVKSGRGRHHPTIHRLMECGTRLRRMQARVPPVAYPYKLRFLAVFAVLAGNLQRAGSRSPQKSWLQTIKQSEKAAKRAAVFHRLRCFHIKCICNDDFGLRMPLRTGAEMWKGYHSGMRFVNLSIDQFFKIHRSALTQSEARWP